MKRCAVLWLGLCLFVSVGCVVGDDGDGDLGEEFDPSEVIDRPYSDYYCEYFPGEALCFYSDGCVIRFSRNELTGEIYASQWANCPEL